VDEDDEDETREDEEEEEDENTTGRTVESEKEGARGSSHVSKRSCPSSSLST
jgi:hypothetical protein